MVSSIETRIDGRAASPMLVTGTFFQLLGVHAGLEVWARTHPKTVGGRPVSITLEPRQGTLSDDWLEVIAFFLPHCSFEVPSRRLRRARPPNEGHDQRADCQ